MYFLKNAWVTPYTEDLNNLTLESQDPRMYSIQNNSLSFPEKPTPEHPLRHTIVIGLLSDEDLLKLCDTIWDHLRKKGFI